MGIGGLMKLTKTLIDKVAAPLHKDQAFYRDDQLKGFALRVTKNGVKSFVVETTIGNKVRRITLGRYGVLSLEQARGEAAKLLGKITTGIDPIAEKKAKQISQITLEQAFNDYVAARKSLKAVTVLDYQAVLRQVMPDWLSKPLLNITRSMVVKRHTQYGETNSKARSNLSMRLLRAIFNFAINQYQTPDLKALIQDNPVACLSHTRAWYRVEARQSLIKHHQLEIWYKGLMELSDYFPYSSAQLWHDYFLLILFTGLRQTEAASLMWEQVDLKTKSFQLIDTKNRSNHLLPMSDMVYSIFERRRELTKSEFVFPAESKEGYVSDHRKAMWKVTELSGIEFKLHDLRRTFITMAESLDISAYSLKRLLNHKMRNDVTSGYIISDVERLRKPMQQVSDYLLKGIKSEVDA